MTADHPATQLKGISLSEILALGARKFFSFVVKVFETWDELPLEQKYPFKESLFKILSQSGNKESDILFRDERELARILVNRGWWVLQRDITGPIQREILRLEQEDKDDQIDDYFCSLFAKDDHARLEAKISGWFGISYLANRKAILMDCLWAHRQGRFNLTIPCLLALVDGLTLEFLGRFPTRRRKKTEPKVIRVKDFASLYKQKEPKLWGNPFYKIVDQFMYQSFRFGSQVPRNSLNRHGILHGHIADYGTEANSLKLFLFLDTIQIFIRVWEGRSKSDKAIAVRAGK